MSEEFLDGPAVIPTVYATYVYPNSDGDVVIKQNQDGEDVFIFIPVAYLQPVIVAMQEAAANTGGVVKPFKRP